MESDATDHGRRQNPLAVWESEGGMVAAEARALQRTKWSVVQAGGKGLNPWFNPHMDNRAGRDALLETAMEGTSDPQIVFSVQPDHEYDLPGSPHLGSAAALNVACSEGPAGFILQGNLDSNQALIALESPIEAAKQMEAGITYDTETVRRLRPLFGVATT